MLTKLPIFIFFITSAFTATYLLGQNKRDPVTVATSKTLVTPPLHQDIAVGPENAKVNSPLPIPLEPLKHLAAGEPKKEKLEAPVPPDLDWAIGLTNLPAEALEPYFRNGTPKSIHLIDGNGVQIAKNPRSNGDGNGIGQTLYLSTHEGIKNVVQERAQESAHASALTLTQSSKATSLKPPPNGPTSAPSAPSAPAEPQWSALGQKQFSVTSFLPGFLDDRKTRMPFPKDIYKSLGGPDFSLEMFDVNNPADTAKKNDIRSRVVSFGHSGEMVLEVNSGGVIRDLDGPDFTIYENVIDLGRGQYYQEFARVGVAKINQPENYVWFACDPDSGHITGCAGVVPTADGGDRFDLAVIGVNEVRYIKIQDTGHNHNMGGPGDNVEGFDLDSLDLIHAYTKEN